MLGLVQQEIGSRAQSVTIEQWRNLPEQSQCVIGFWNMESRRDFIRDPLVSKMKWPSYIDSRSTVLTQDIGDGTFVYPLAYIGSCVTIGSFCAVSQMSSISHGCCTGNNNVFSPGVLVAGSSRIGNNVVFGVNSIVRDNVTISDDIVFFMDSVVTKDILEPGTYYGNRKTQ